MFEHLAKLIDTKMNPAAAAAVAAARHQVIEQ